MKKKKKWFEKQQISSMFDINIFGFGIDNINRMECIIIDSERQNNNNNKKNEKLSWTIKKTIKIAMIMIIIINLYGDIKM